MLVEETLLGTVDKVDIAIKRIQTFEKYALELKPDEGYRVAFSGGKDSQVVLDLVQRSGVKHFAEMMLTSVDPPELLAFIREHYPYVRRSKPPKSMFKLIAQKAYLPSYKVRYCCEVLKERGGFGYYVITGIRWQESVRRSKRGMIERCMKDKDTMYLNPIIDWTDLEVWEYIKTRKLPYCKLYDQGWKRIGCIGCPMTKYNHLEQYPKYVKAYKRACQKAIDSRRDTEKPLTWKTADEMFNWWIRQEVEDADMPLFE